MVISDTTSTDRFSSPSTSTATAAATLDHTPSAHVNTSVLSGVDDCHSVASSNGTSSGRTSPELEISSTHSSPQPYHINHGPATHTPSPPFSIIHTPHPHPHPQHHPLFFPFADDGSLDDMASVHWLNDPKHIHDINQPHTTYLERNLSGTLSIPFTLTPPSINNPLTLTHPRDTSISFDLPNNEPALGGPFPAHPPLLGAHSISSISPQSHITYTGEITLTPPGLCGLGLESPPSQQAFHISPTRPSPSGSPIAVVTLPQPQARPADPTHDRENAPNCSTPCANTCRMITTPRGVATPLRTPKSKSKPKSSPKSSAKSKSRSKSRSKTKIKREPDDDDYEPPRTSILEQPRNLSTPTSKRTLFATSQKKSKLSLDVSSTNSESNITYSDSMTDSDSINHDDISVGTESTHAHVMTYPIAPLYMIARRVHYILRRDNLTQRAMTNDLTFSGSTLSPMLKNKYAHTKDTHVAELRQWCHHQDEKLLQKLKTKAQLQNIEQSQMYITLGISTEQFMSWYTFEMDINQRHSIDEMVLVWLGERAVAHEILQQEQDHMELSTETTTSSSPRRSTRKRKQPLEPISEENNTPRKKLAASPRKSRDIITYHDTPTKRQLKMESEELRPPTMPPIDPITLHQSPLSPRPASSPAHSHDFFSSSSTLVTSRPHSTLPITSYPTTVSPLTSQQQQQLQFIEQQIQQWKIAKQRILSAPTATSLTVPTPTS